MQERYSRKHWEIFGWFKFGTRENIPCSITPWKLPSIKVPYYRFPRFFSFPIAFHFDELSSIIPPTIRDKRNETRVDRTSCFVGGGRLKDVGHYPWFENSCENLRSNGGEKEGMDRIETGRCGVRGSSGETRSAERIGERVEQRVERNCAIFPTGRVDYG